MAIMAGFDGVKLGILATFVPKRHPFLVGVKTADIAGDDEALNFTGSLADF